MCPVSVSDFKYTDYPAPAMAGFQPDDSYSMISSWVWKPLALKLLFCFINLKVDVCDSNIFSLVTCSLYYFCRKTVLTYMTDNFSVCNY